MVRTPASNADTRTDSARGPSEDGDNASRVRFLDPVRDQHLVRLIDENLSDSSRRQEFRDEAGAITQAVYSDAPISGPSDFVDRVRAQANFVQRLPEGWTIGTGGPLGQLTRREQEEEEAKKAASGFEEAFGGLTREQRIEREQWQRESHSFAGVTMTGREWGQMGEELRRDGPLREQLIERLMREGRTREEAQRRATEIADVATAISIPPNQRTPAQNAAIEQARRDPDFRRHLGYAAQRSRGADGPVTQLERRTMDAGQDTSTSTRRDILASSSLDSPRLAPSGNPSRDGQNEAIPVRTTNVAQTLDTMDTRRSVFSTAPNATTDFQAAVTPRQSTEPTPSSNTRLATTAPLPVSSPSGGLDAV